MSYVSLVVVALILHGSFALIKNEDLYPYGTEHGDKVLRKNDDLFTDPLVLKYPFPFFSGVYKSNYVNTNGAISFERGISQFTPDPFPVKHRMIGPFWADVDTRNHGDVFYRETDDKAILLRASKDIQDNFVKSHWNFKATSVFIATWDKVTYYGGSDLTPQNTFQSILVTDGRSSFSIFLYNNITWTTGQASGGNTNGLGGIAAQVGFNAGDGKNFFAVNASRTADILNIGETSNVGVPGKWMFRIDGLKIETAPECDIKGSAVIISPNTVQLKGGDTIYISGPCFTSTMEIKCEFGNLVVTGKVDSVLRASCVVPPLKSGNITVGVSTNGGKTFTKGTNTLVVECNDGFWGPPECQTACPKCANSSLCDKIDGRCPTSCGAGYGNPPFCDRACAPGTFGVNCASTCHCEHDRPCHPEFGTCEFNKCAIGWKGPNCQEKAVLVPTCPLGKFGPGCSRDCHCKDPTKCLAETGACTDKLCMTGWTDTNCQKACPAGKFGDDCQETCHCLQASGALVACNHVNGDCPSGCAVGYKGHNCQERCGADEYGPGCSKTCHCKNGVACNNEFGSCPNNLCAPGWMGKSCSDRDWQVCIYNGKPHKQGDQWELNCRTKCFCAHAVMNLTLCQDTCPKYEILPSDCRLENDGKECCPKPVCGWFERCRYKGKSYSQGQTWSDGCDTTCQCINAKMSFSSCRSKCPTYSTIPATCRLVTLPGKCCQELQCPDNIKTSTVITGGTKVISFIDAFVIKTPRPGLSVGPLEPSTGTLTPPGPQGTKSPDLGSACPGGCQILPTITVNEKPCFDRLDNCPHYTKYACFGVYRPWAIKNCAKYCGLCPTNGGSGDGAPCHFPFTYKGRNITKCIVDGHDRPWCSVTQEYEKDIQWGNCHSSMGKDYCSNRISDCLKYGTSACRGSYLEWGKKNCARYCGYCSRVKGVIQGTIPTRAPRPLTTASRIAPARQTTARRIPEPSKTRSPPLGPGPGPSPSTHCDYFGNSYKQNERWRYKCDVCFCLDPASNQVACSSACIPDKDWDKYLPITCTLQPRPGKCCKGPVCPINGIPAGMKYPPGYIDE